MKNSLETTLETLSLALLLQYQESLREFVGTKLRELILYKGHKTPFKKPGVNTIGFQVAQKYAVGEIRCFLRTIVLKTDQICTIRCFKKT
jgi:hypothetical protein